MCGTEFELNLQIQDQVDKILTSKVFRKSDKDKFTGLQKILKTIELTLKYERNLKQGGTLR